MIIIIIIIIVTVPLLEPGHLEENYPITTFFENRRFSSFFFLTKQTNKNQRSTMQPLKTLKSFKLF